VWNLLRNEEVLCEMRSGNEDFVPAPPCLLSQTAKGVTRVQVIRSVDILHFS